MNKQSVHEEKLMANQVKCLVSCLWPLSALSEDLHVSFVQLLRFDSVFAML